ncbi:MAG TPA: FAD-dependent oxidoreductase [Pyrinomonadaceae bacterium]
MLGSLDKRRREATIVGAGIAGMLAAYQLDKQGYRVTLLESASRAGGLIETRRTEYGIAETAAHSLLATTAVKELCRDLGVELLEVRKDSRARFIVRDGKLRKFPLSIGETLSAINHAAFSRALNHLDEQTLDVWGRRHLGEGALQYLLTPMVRGIYGVQPSELGVAASFPSLLIEPGQTLLGSMLRKTFKRSPSKNEKKEKGSRKRMVAPRHGMGDLTGRLERQLEQRLGGRFRRGITIDALPDAANLILATPSYVTANLLANVAPELSQSLLEIPYTPLVTVTAFVSRSSFSREVKGVGALVPSSEERKSLGILFTSSSFANRVFDESRHASFTILFGGTAQPQWVSASDEEIRWAVREELAKLLGIDGEPLELVITRWPRAIPQYSTELPRVWTTAGEGWCKQPGRMLFGNYTGQVSMRGMIESAASLR